MINHDKHTIHVNASKCVGCLTCQLYCSYRKTSSFNPAVANIRIDRLPQGFGYNIHFIDNCDKCLLCVRKCLYEALSCVEEGKPNESN